MDYTKYRNWVQEKYNEFLTFLGIKLVDKNEYSVQVVDYDGQCSFTVYSANGVLWKTTSPFFDDLEVRSQFYNLIVEDYDEGEVSLWIPYFDNSSIFNKALTIQFAKAVRNGVVRFNNILEDSVNEVSKNYINLPDIDVIVKLSKVKYEKRECLGSILFISQDIKLDIVFKNKIVFNYQGLRQIRKLMELTDESMSLIVKDKKIVGLASCTHYDYKLNINGFSKWELCDINEKILLYDDTFLRVNSPAYNYCQKIQNYFELSFDDASRLNNIVELCSKCEHGAIIIFTEEAEKETVRLSNLNRAIMIKPIELYASQIVTNLSNIDGAIIIGIDGKCYGIGAILDGNALIEGNMSRGARYNSTINYIANKENKKYMAIIISEDKYINAIDTLDIKLLEVLP